MAPPEEIYVLHGRGRSVGEEVLWRFRGCTATLTCARSRRSPASAAPSTGANNGGAESINGLIELARRVARGFRNPDNDRLRMLLIGGGLRL